MSDDEDEYDEAGEGSRLLGFMFGNVDGSGGLDADYLDEDAKEHLSALADKLGTSLTDIDLIKPFPSSADASEQDYDEKAEDAVDYEDIDEQYDGPEIQAAAELLPEEEYLSKNILLESLNPKASVFDDDDYDEDEIVDKNEVSKGERLDPDGLKETSSDVYVLPASSVPEALPSQFKDDDEEACFVQEKTLPKIEPSLPILCIEDGAVILRFSEIFGVHEPLQKSDMKGHHHRQYITEEHAKMMNDIVEEDELEYLRTSSYNLHASRSLSSSFHNANGDIEDAVSHVDIHVKDLSLSSQPMKDDMTSELFWGQISEPCPSFYPLDQLDWEDKIMWGNSPMSIQGCSEFFAGSESQSDTETEGWQREDNNAGDKDLILSNSFSSMKSVYSRDSLMLAYSQSLENGFHGNALCLESSSQKGVVCLLLKDDHAPSDVFTGNILHRFNKHFFLNKDLLDGSWLDQVIWDSEEAISKPKLILDLHDEKMFFDILDHNDGERIRSHASAVVVSRSSKASDVDITDRHSHGMPSVGKFNISNDKFYTSRKISQHVKSQAKRRASHGIKVLHSIPALRLQTIKPKLSNKDVANFHRPRALWYPHVNRFAGKFQGSLRTDGLLKIIVFCLGGKILKLTVDAAETVASVKLKALKKLDLRTPEKIKLFYSGKLLEDDKSLALQDICPNSVVHLACTTINLWPRAQRLPGENKPLRPPGAFKKRSDLSVKEGHVFLMEYCEERPLLLGNSGMGARLCTYYQKSLPSEQNGPSMRNCINGPGSLLVLDPADKSPFLGDIGHGRGQSCLETNMYRAPIFPHKLLMTDYLLVRSAKGTLFIRRIDKLYVAGQQEPHMEVLSPGSKNAQAYLVTRMLLYVYREFRVKQKLVPVPNIRADDLAALFTGLTDAIIRKRLKHCADLKRGANGNLFWVKRNDFRLPSEEELRRMLTPETVCSHESMQAGLYRLKHLGITQLTHPIGLSSAMNQLPDEAIALAAASHIERELQITSWNLSSNFVACTNQDRENIERLEITGVGDPSGRGLGFSYVRITPKAPITGGSVKKKVAPARGGSTVTGTDADLRRLSMDAAREVLLKFEVPEEHIAKLTRWHRIALVRKLSSEQAATGIKVDAVTLNKFARGQRMSFLQLQQQAREKCQEIWERQLQSLSAAYGDENESDSDANSDLDSFAGDLENLLDAEEFEDEESGHADSRGNKDGFRLLKMRRCPSQAQAEEEIEDEEEEAAFICRYLDDNGDEMTKNKFTGADVGADNVDYANKLTFSARQLSGTSYPESAFPPKEMMMHDHDEIEVLLGGMHTPSQSKNKKVIIKTDGTYVGLQKKKTQPKEGIKIPKEKKQIDKPIRESFVCGACGQLGHMRTNKNCPKNKDTETTSEHEVAAGKPYTPDSVAQKQHKSLSKKPTVKANIAQVDTQESGEMSSQGKVPLLKFKYATVDKPPDKGTSLSLASETQIALRDVEPKTAGKISKIRFSSKIKLDDSPPSVRPTALVIRPPERDRLSERDHPSTKIVIRKPRSIHSAQVRNAVGIGLARGSRKMKKIVELSGFVEHQQQENPWSDEEVKNEPLYSKRFWEKDRRKKDGNVEQRNRRMHDGKRNVHEEQPRLFASTRSEEVYRMDERQKLKNKKKNKPDLSDDYLMDHQSYINEQRIMERSRAAKRRQSFDAELEFAPAKKRRRGGEVDLSNILKNIVESLRENHEISYLFLKPVSKKDAPDYYTVVKKPMDLSTIREKVRNLEYKNHGDFREDVWQINYNAHKYNDNRNPGIPPLADRLLELCDYHLELNRDLLNEAEEGR